MNDGVSRRGFFGGVAGLFAFGGTMSADNANSDRPGRESDANWFYPTIVTFVYDPASPTPFVPVEIKPAHARLDSQLQWPWHEAPTQA